MTSRLHIGARALALLALGGALWLQTRLPPTDPEEASGRARHVPPWSSREFGAGEGAGAPEGKPHAARRTALLRAFSTLPPSIAAIRTQPPAQPQWRVAPAAPPPRLLASLPAETVPPRDGAPSSSPSPHPGLAPSRDAAPDAGAHHGTEDVRAEAEAFGLIGVFLSREERRATLQMPDGAFVRVRQGETVRGWRVSRIDEKSITIDRDGVSHRLDLSE